MFRMYTVHFMFSTLSIKNYIVNIHNELDTYSEYKIYTINTMMCTQCKLFQQDVHKSIPKVKNAQFMQNNVYINFVFLTCTDNSCSVAASKSNPQKVTPMTTKAIYSCLPCNFFDIIIIFSVIILKFLNVCLPACLFV